MVTGTNDRWLKTGVALPILYRIAEPYLHMLDFVNLQRETSRAFMYRYDSTGIASSTEKETPPKFNVGADLPEIDRHRMSVTAKVIESKGFAMRLERELIDSEAGESEIMKSYETAAYILAEVMNTSILTAATTSGNYKTTTYFSPAETWANAGGTATPIADLQNLARDMHTTGYVHRLRDVFLHPNGYYELLGYIRDMDIPESTRRAYYGIPDTTEDIIRVPQVGTIHLVESGITDGYVLGLDSINKGIEVHYYNDSKFSVPTLRYETMLNGQLVPKTVPNMGFHFYQYEEPDSHDTVMQFWLENKPVVTQPYAQIYGSGI